MRLPHTVQIWVVFGNSTACPVPCPALKQCFPTASRHRPSGKLARPRPMCRGCGTAGDSAGLGTVLLPGHRWQRPQLCQACRMALLCPDGAAGSCGRAGAQPSGSTEHHPTDRMLQSSDKGETEAWGSGGRSLRHSPVPRQGQPRAPFSPPTPVPFADPNPAPFCGDRVSLRSCEERREPKAGAVLLPRRPSMGPLCAPRRS